MFDKLVREYIRIVVEGYVGFFTIRLHKFLRILLFIITIKYRTKYISAKTITSIVSKLAPRITKLDKAKCFFIMYHSVCLQFWLKACHSVFDIFPWIVIIPCIVQVKLWWDTFF